MSTVKKAMPLVDQIKLIISQSNAEHENPAVIEEDE